MRRRDHHRLFDRYVVVDWSAANRPATGVDSIWIAMLDADDGAGSCVEVPMSNPSTRRLAEAELAVATADSRRRTLVAVDAPLGFPTGAAAWFGLDATGWRAMWRVLAELVEDDATNRNNRFDVAGALNRRGRPPGPFWGAPVGTEIDGLGRSKPGRWPVPELRHAELALLERGLRPASCWQLLGVGSVGSQILTLLPVVDRFLTRDGWEVWPMTTGFTAPARGHVVVAETWPTAFGIDVPIWMVRDAAQVAQVALALRDADEGGELGSWFEPAAPDEALDEGWALVPPASAD